MTRVWQNALAPEAYGIDIVPGTSGVDLSTVTAASFKVKKPDGTTTTWTATRSNQTATTLTLTHTMPASAPSDVDQQGTFWIYALLTVPGGSVRTKPRALLVEPEYGGAP